MPQVCRTWREAAATPSRMWEGLSISVGCACLPGEAQHAQRPHPRRGVDCNRLRAWLAPRSACVHTLMISGFQEDPPLHRYALMIRHLPCMDGMHACKAACLEKVDTPRFCVETVAALLYLQPGPDLQYRLLEAALPHLAALQELRVFSACVMQAHDLALLPRLLRSAPHSATAGCMLRELSLSFAPAEGFAAADLDALGGCAAVPSLCA